MNRFAILMIALLGTSGCLRKTEFQCQDSTQCGAGNTCETTGYCSFPDTQCQRYTESAGPLAGQCVNGTGIDGGMDIDASTGDGGVDAPNAGCPAGYNDLPGVANGHKYKIVTAIEGWAAQRTACSVTSSSAYLAIPDDAAEMMAMSTAAGGDYWVGIQDPTEGMYINTKGQPQTFLPWAAGQPDNAGPGEGADCVASNATPEIRDERCNTKYRAICECEP